MTLSTWFTSVLSNKMLDCYPQSTVTEREQETLSENLRFALCVFWPRFLLWETSRFPVDCSTCSQWTGSPKTYLSQDICFSTRWHFVFGIIYILRSEVCKTVSKVRLSIGWTEEKPVWSKWFGWMLRGSYICPSDSVEDLQRQSW